MLIESLELVKINLKTLSLKIKIDQCDSNIPCVFDLGEHGLYWFPVINIDTGEIINWNGEKNSIVSVVIKNPYDIIFHDDDLKLYYYRDIDTIPSFLKNTNENTIRLVISENGVIENWSFDINDYNEIKRVLINN